MYNARTEQRRAWLQASPALIWLGFFFLAPLVLILIYSFQGRANDGTVLWNWSLANYQKLFADGAFWRTLWLSTWIALVVTAITLVVSYPLAFFMATRSPKRRGLLVLAVMIPFWTNFLVRIYAWKVLLGNNGVVNRFLDQFDLGPLQMINNPSAVIMALIYGELPYMILPLYAALERFDWVQLEAARDLGAGRFQTFWRVLLPQTLPGITAGSILVFVPTVGTFAVSDILGGTSVNMVGNSLSLQFGSASNWAYGSAISMIFMLLLLGAILLYFKATREVNDGENPG
ncbi:ABC transporter permease [Herpetosiphon sp. NSE202]|uniref:ABC transporter permease n=1 Tax=Herpetosiphon sp. NSE202 TaxID=3351349 RepID=UPI003631B460